MQDIKQQALEVIEMITSSDFCQNLELRYLSDLENKEKMTEDEKTAHKIIAQIYRYSHSVIGRCGNKHLDWQKEIKEAHKCFKEQENVDKTR